MLPAIIVLGVVTTIVFLVIRVYKGGLPAMFTKACASACFIGTACAAFSYNHDDFNYGILMLLGFIFSLLGDIWLDLKYVYKHHECVYTMAGFICFMVGHCFFIPAMFSDYGKFKAWYPVLAAAICAVCAAAVLLTEKALKMNYGKYRKAAVVYSFLVSGSLVTAVIGMAVTGFSTKYILLSVGAAAFLLSDGVLSFIYFKEGGNTKVNVVINHILYYFAQFAFASTLLFN